MPPIGKATKLLGCFRQYLKLVSRYLLGQPRALDGRKVSYSRDNIALRHHLPSGERSEEKRNFIVWHGRMNP